LKTVRRLRGALVASVLCCAAAGTVAAQAGALLPPATVAPRAVRPAGAPCAGAGVRPTSTNKAAIDAATLCLINKVRAAHHVPALRSNGDLGAVAASQVAAMVRMDYFADVRPTGQTPLALVFTTRYSANSTGVSVGQNIAWGTGRYATPARVVAAWMASPPHRRVMLEAGYRDAGVAVTPRVPSVLARGQAGATYAIEFGVRRFPRR
jgi:uncharacterized protein YkwD